MSKYCRNNYSKVCCVKGMKYNSDSYVCKSGWRPPGGQRLLVIQQTIPIFQSPELHFLAGLASKCSYNCVLVNGKKAENTCYFWISSLNIFTKGSLCSLPSVNGKDSRGSKAMEMLGLAWLCRTTPAQIITQNSKATQTRPHHSWKNNSYCAKLLKFTAI